ncbi:MAG: T9SS type A sorting domain-containing protein [Balneolaceae bacterium]|nr:T9SS type A sorting domain-containing protein [Balneolaceae bacterium]MBO6547225.1 T9SS type A sorting domain-containing protein [Balneolaceae bacterium]MBO6647828.1 T9SS type A sorting domain-containing protein [Balneolaceae bacterium]
MEKSLFFFIVLALLSSTVFAQDKIWTGAIDSSWHTAGNWSPSGVPGTSQTVGLRGNTTPYPVITSNVTIRSVTINAWYSNPGDQLRIRNNATLTITDDMIINGAGKLQIINGHVEMTATTSGQNNFDVNSAESEINITNGSFTAGTLSEDVDVEIIGSFNAGNGTVTVNGDFDVSNSDTFNAESGVVIINGDALINGTYNGDNGTTTFNGTMTIRSGGVMNLDSGTINLNGNTSVSNNGTVNFGSGVVNIASDVNVSSGGYFNVEDATVNVTGNASFSSNGNLSVDSGTINIGGNASLSSGGTIDLNNGSLDVGGDASFTSGGTVNAGSGTITLEGDFTVQNSSNFNSDSSTVIFSGDSTQTVSSGSDITFFNVQVDSGATFNTDGGTGNTVTIEGDLIVDEDGEVEVQDDDQLDVEGEIGGDGADNVQSPAPFAASVNAPTTTSLTIIFNKAMTESLAENTANYAIQRVSNGSSISVTSATLNTSGNSKTVTLVIGTILEDVEYRVVMNNLESTDGGELSDNHTKRFTKIGTITFYSRQNGNWSTNSTWSRTGHTGSAASSNPGNTNNAVIIVGDSDVVTIASSTSIANQTSVEVKSGAVLRVGTGGVLTTGTKNITGLGTFEVTTGVLQIGSNNGISASGATGNIQTATRIFGTSGSYTYNGSSAQITGTGLPSTVNNLTVNNSSGVTIDDDLEVSGTLVLTSGSFTIESGNNLIANTKSIGSGDLIMKQIITGSLGWRLLSSPIDTDYADFLDGITTQGYSGSTLGNAALDSLQPNVLYYDETYPGTDNQRWRAPASAATSLTPGQGLYTFIFGDIAADSRYNNAFPRTLTVQGQENEGPVDLNVTYTTAADSGWNLVGNPYASTINWDDVNWTKTNIDATIYVWDYATSEYKTWNGVTGDLGDGLIAPFQGFWVKTNAASPSLIVQENAKTTGGSFVGKRISKRVSSDDTPVFSITLADDQSETSTHFMFSEPSKIGKDPLDGYRLAPQTGVSTYIELSSINEHKDKLSINNLPRYFGIPIEIPLQVDAFEQGLSVEKPLNFQFNNFKNIPNGWEIYLIDKRENTEVKVSAGSIVPFDFYGSNERVAPNAERDKKAKITTKAAPDADRFYLKIVPGFDAEVNNLPDDFELLQNYPNPFNPSTNIEFSLPIQSQVSVKIYDLLGREITTLVSGELEAGSHRYSWDAFNQSSGIYFYRLITRDQSITKKMTLIK